MANPNERKGKSTAVRSTELIRDAQVAVEKGGGFAFKSWSEAALDLASTVGRPTASNVAKAAGGAGLALISPPLAALAGTIVGSLSFVGDGLVDAVWGPIEERLWSYVDGDAMAKVRQKAQTDIKAKEVLDELQEQLSQIVASGKAIDDAPTSSVTYCDEIYNVALVFETMKKNIPGARANAQALRDFLDQVLKVLPTEGEIQQKEQTMKQFVASTLDTLPRHYDGAWIQGRTSMCSNTRCRGPAA